ncbi:HlyD family efflux transporter periplasmic adaptor subunit [Silvimonas iriomotensis]|uniref:Peptidase M50 domain-containing protein n=1 Tax=Silvimonas iriomotensis TaxID=449662 RepID=A0ABQ2P5U4_9NEIS|nr:HlyD family efflux transporter periplasmic adaptor subunit [Silvimonas iriomotensis]GGP18851.1 hypothetical protein GCM10010970_07710 [Silvimonas iriomotensis]
MSFAASLPFAPLREDLKLIKAAPGPDGEPAWMIQDAIINRFYRIGWLEFEFLLRWALPPDRICADIAASTALKPDEAQLEDFQRFLDGHNLLRPTQEKLARLQQQATHTDVFSWRWLLHHYLFFRIPLVRPQRFLAWLTGHIGWLFTRTTVVAVLLLTLLGLTLVLHQWDTFTSSVVESFSMQGILSFALALAFAKTLHELGHALVATRLGLRVAHMGVAFVVMLPMLYTDTGESWKLPSARQRLAVASAGILAELALAGLATLGWVLVEPGALRNALLYLATTSWVLSLALNASPFMRFDGYFILSDLLDFPNLHERASAQARVALRRFLWGMDEPWPEPFEPRQRRLLITFEYITWVYRFTLFLGIAATVYLFFFKLLGLILFAVEITWFIVMPIWRELKYWWAHRARIKTSRRLVFWALLGGGIILTALPWQRQIAAVGVARTAQQLRVFVPFPARILQIHPAGQVQAGDLLMTMDEPDIAARLLGSEAGRQGYEARLAGLIADDKGLDEQLATEEQASVQARESNSARKEMARLTLKAPFAGRWMDVDPAWRQGQWMGPRQAIGVLVNPAQWQVDAYVRQDDVQQINPGDSIRFYPDGAAHALTGKVVSVGNTRVRQLDYPMLSAHYKGPIPVAAAEDGLTPNPPVFHVLIQLTQVPDGLRETRGQIQILGQRQSFLVEGATRLLSAVLKESGF